VKRPPAERATPKNPTGGFSTAPPSSHPSLNARDRYRLNSTGPRCTAQHRHFLPMTRKLASGAAPQPREAIANALHFGGTRRSRG
jgi:hypothetical protein